MTTLNRPAIKPQSEWRNGARPAIASAIGYATGSGVITLTSSLFLPPIIKETGWSTTEALIAPILAGVGVIMAMFVGRLINRFGPSRVVVVGLVGSALSIAFLVLAPFNLVTYYSFALVFGVFATLCALNPFTRVIADWFTHSLGKAFGFMGALAAVVGLVLTPAVAATIAAFGWRGGYVLLGLVMIVICLPATLWGVHLRRIDDAATPDARDWRSRRAPEPVHTDSETSGSDALDLAIARPSDLNLVKATQALRSPSLWVLCVCLALVLGTVSAFLANMFPIMLGAGLNPVAAVAVTSLYFLGSLAGRVFAGLALDVISRYVIVAIVVVLGVVGCLLLANVAPISFGLALFGILLVAFAGGGEADYMGYFIAKEFGQKSLAIAFGMVITFIQIGAIVGPLVFGMIKDATGSYSAAINLSSILLFVALAGFVVRGFARRRKKAAATLRGSELVPTA
jgi:MFS family permease